MQKELRNPFMEICILHLSQPFLSHSRIYPLPIYSNFLLCFDLWFLSQNKEHFSRETFSEAQFERQKIFIQKDPTICLSYFLEEFLLKYSHSWES